MTPEETFRSLQATARRGGLSVQELLTLYVLEQFLVRLSRTEYADSFVLKGGTLLAAYGIADRSD